MRLSDLGEESQKGLVDTGGKEEKNEEDVPVFDTSTGGRMKSKKDFGEFKFE